MVVPANTEADSISASGKPSRGQLSKYVGHRVEISGNLKAAGGWRRRTRPCGKPRVRVLPATNRPAL